VDRINQLLQQLVEADRSNQDLVDDLTDMIYMLRKAKDPYTRDLIKQNIREINRKLQEKNLLPEADDEVELEPLDPTMSYSDEEMLDAIRKEQLEKVIANMLTTTDKTGKEILNTREKVVLIKRFGLYGRDEQTLASIAKEFGVDQTRIRQIETKALNKLRTSISVNKIWKPEVDSPLFNRDVDNPNWFGQRQKNIKLSKMHQDRDDKIQKKREDYLNSTMRQEVPERKLSKKEIKTRDKYADDLPDKEFKKRYGKDWESVKYATATKMAKKKNEAVEQELMDQWQQEKQQPLNEIGIPTIIRYLATKKIRDKAAHDAAREAGTKATSKKSPEVQMQNRANAEKRLGDYRPEMKPQIQQTPKPSNTIDQPIKSLQTTSSKRPMPASTKKPANDPTVESLMDQWLAEKNGDMDVSLTKGNKTS